MLTMTDSLLAVLNETFTEDLDGYFYPGPKERSLVRVQVGGGAYSVERRRNARTPWLPVSTALVDEFDARLWREWRERWPQLVA
jgi:hypothetical protein